MQIVCGGGGGLGEETAVAMAEHGATVVVNDLGVDVSGEGSDAQPAQETVDRIEDVGGEAMAHVGDEGAWTAAEIDERWDDLTEGIETMRTNPGY